MSCQDYSCYWYLVNQNNIFHAGWWGSISREGNPSRSWYVSEQNLEKGGWNPQPWLAIHLGDGNSEQSPVCLDMHSAGAQRLFGQVGQKKSWCYSTTATCCGTRRAPHGTKAVVVIHFIRIRLQTSRLVSGHSQEERQRQRDREREGERLTAQLYLTIIQFPALVILVIQDTTAYTASTHTYNQNRSPVAMGEWLSSMWRTHCKL